MTFRRLATFSAIGIMAAAIGFTAPATAQTKVDLAGGYKVTTSGTGFCSLGSVGYDDFGNTVGMIAGHCMAKVGDPVYLCADQTVNVLSPACGLPPEPRIPVGHYATASTGWANGTQNDMTIDYAAIKLDSAVVNLKRTTPNGLVINKIGPVPTVGETMCKDGKRTGKSCGQIFSVSNNQIGSWATFAWFGDSGSPAVVGDGLVGFTSTLGIGFNGAFIYSGVHGALADMAKQGNVVGRGFEPGGS